MKTLISRLNLSARLSNEYLINQQLSNDEIHNEIEEGADKNVKSLTVKHMNEAFMHHITFFDYHGRM